MPYDASVAITAEGERRQHLFRTPPDRRPHCPAYRTTRHGRGRVENGSPSRRADPMVNQDWWARLIAIEGSDARQARARTGATPGARARTSALAVPVVLVCGVCPACLDRVSFADGPWSPEVPDHALMVARRVLDGEPGVVPRSTRRRPRPRTKWSSPPRAPGPTWPGCTHPPRRGAGGRCGGSPVG